MSRLLFFALAVALAWGCANVKPPTGGPQDFDPPVLDSAATIPAHGQTNFKGQKLVFPFNEDIGAVQASQKIIFNPALDFRLDARVYGKRLEILLTEPLDSATTYTLEFWSLVTDLTEKNPIPALRWTFSTGPVLDTLTLSGVVRNNETEKPLAGALVALYPVDSADPKIVRREPGLFLTKTDWSGRFRFLGLPAGQFWLYAFADANDSRRADEKEEIALWPEPIDLQALTKVELRSFSVDADSLRYQGGKQDGQVLRFKFSRPMLRAGLLDRSTARLLPYLDEKTGEVLQPLTPGEDTTFVAEFWAEDGLGDRIEVRDTLRLRAVPKPTKPAVQRPSSQYEPGDSIRLVFDQPIVDWLADSVWIQIDSTEKLGGLDLAGSWSTDRREWRLPLDENWGARFALVIKDSAFVSAFGRGSGKDSIPFSPKAEEDYASIEGTVKTELANYWLLLTNEKGESVRNCYNCKTFDWQYLTPGTYRFRIRVDENGDGRYETGSVVKRLAPEPAFFLPKEHFVRANWTLAELVLSF